MTAPNAFSSGSAEIQHWRRKYVLGKSLSAVVCRSGPLYTVSMNDEIKLHKISFFRMGNDVTVE
jgi:hypothetical protein